MPAGRPTKMTPDTLSKLREAFLWGCSDPEACLYADIDPSTLYRYQKENPNFASEKRLWQSNPTLRARRAVANALETDPGLALKYLERKLPEEFYVRRDLKTNSELDGKAASLLDILHRSRELSAMPPEVVKEIPRAGLTLVEFRQMATLEEQEDLADKKAAS